MCVCNCTNGNIQCIYNKVDLYKYIVHFFMALMLQPEPVYGDTEVHVQFYIVKVHISV